jgi:large subunit ribosomal protein L27e
MKSGRILSSLLSLKMRNFEFWPFDIHFMEIIKADKTFFVTYTLLIVCSHLDDGEKSTNKKFGSVLVVGIDHYPLSVTCSISTKKTERRSRMKAVIKLLNYNHLMPARSNFDVDYKDAVSLDSVKTPKIRKRSERKSKSFWEKNTSNSTTKLI